MTKVNVRESFSEHLLVDRKPQSFIMLHVSIISMLRIYTRCVVMHVNAEYAYWHEGI